MSGEHLNERYSMKQEGYKDFVIETNFCVGPEGAGERDTHTKCDNKLKSIELFITPKNVLVSLLVTITNLFLIP